MMKRLVKKLVANSSLLRNAMNRLTGDFPKVFVYHRFAPPGVAIAHRVSADEFGWQLDQLMHKFNVITLGQCLSHFRERRKWPRNSVIITVDDGYRDFYEFAYPELLKRGLNATFFVTTNFVDGKIWLWPDRLWHAIHQTDKTEISILLNGVSVRFPMNDNEEKIRTSHALTAYCIANSHAEKERAISEVLRALGIDLPEVPYPEYGAVSWDELREVCSGGIEIGSHTMNHPILSRIDQAQLTEEVFISKQVLEKELGAEIMSFCYPNSGPGDITDEVVESVEKAGYAGAVFGIDLKAWLPFRVPRMGVTHDRIDFLWKLYGGESL